MNTWFQCSDSFCFVTEGGGGKEKKRKSSPCESESESPKSSRETSTFASRFHRGGFDNGERRPPAH